MGKKRIRTFDIAKGIAIFLVVFGHALQGIRDSEGLSANSAHSSIFLICSIIYTFHMPLFFFISGLFVHSWSHRSFKIALSQKIKSLVIPYFIWTIIVGAFMQVAKKYTNNGLGLHQVLISWRVPFSEYWFLYVLFIIFLIYYLFVNYIKSGEIYLFVLSIVMYIFIPLNINFWIVGNLQKFLIFFMAGSMISKYLLSHYDSVFTLNKTLIVTVMFAIATGVYVFLTKMRINGIVMNYYYLLMALLGISFVILVSNSIDKLNNIITVFVNWNGARSMDIYVMHLLPLAGSRILAIKLLGITNLWMIVLSITLLSLISCYIGYFILDKLKLSGIMFGR